MSVSFLFLLFVVGLRVHYRDGHIDGAMQTALFEADVLQHKAKALVADDAKDMIIIEQLFALGFFSRIYTNAGYEMLQEKADQGYDPAVMRLAEIQNPSVQAR